MYITQTVIFIVFQWIWADYNILGHTKNKAILVFDPEEHLRAKTGELTKWKGDGEEENLSDF